MPVVGRDPRGFLTLDALRSLLDETTEPPASALTRIVELTRRALDADSVRVLIADYGFVSLQELGRDGPIGPPQSIEGTLAGRAFAKNEIVVSGESPTVVWVPLVDTSERLGVLEITCSTWGDDTRATLDPIVRIVVLVLVSTRRYTDVVHRSRRAQPLSLAAEVQWDLLPPLSCSTERASISGFLEPAYSIGGDSFDYAVNPGCIEFAIIDAVGHGMASVLLSVAAINCWRNARREGASLGTAYSDTSDVIATQFGNSRFVTGQLGRLMLETGELTWLNAGHPLPLLVRDGTFIGELACAPSLPMGLGGPVNEIATETLQPGDRVLFFSDGVVETRSPDGEQFGVARLADFLVRATLDQVFPAETVRRLSGLITTYNSTGLTDDATLLLIEYHGTSRD